MKIVKYYYILIALFVCISLAACSQRNVLQFDISAGIKEVWVSEVRPGRYQVNVSLMEQQQIELSNITEEKKGKRLNVIYKGNILTSARISAKISSGIILIENDLSVDDAKTILEMFEEENFQKTATGVGVRDIKSNTLKEGSLQSAIEEISNFHQTGNKVSLQNALETIEKVIQYDPQLCEGYYLKANILLNSGKNESAAEAISDGINRRCDTIDSRLGSFYLLRGIAFHKAQMKKEAHQEYGLALTSLTNKLQLNPSDIGAVTEFVQALCLLERKEAALEYIANRIDKDPNDKMLQSVYQFVIEFDVPEFLENLS